MGRLTDVKMWVAAVVAVGVVGYLVAVFVGAVTSPPGLPRSNQTFTTMAWAQTEYGSRALFRTVTVRPGGAFTEHFADGGGPDRTGRVPAPILAELRRLATSPDLAAEARWARYVSAPDCTDTDTITITMGELRISARDCPGLTDDALPTFAAISDRFKEVASRAQPPGGA